MADQKRWFKVWNSILTDPTFLITPLDNIGRWVLLGALISLHGKNGRLAIEREALKQILRLKNDNADDNAMITFDLKNIEFRRDENDNGKIIVIMKNWAKYQKDSTSYKRLKEWRKRQNDNGVRGDKKREDKEKEDKYPPDFEEFWKSYPKRKSKVAALRAWKKASCKPPINDLVRIIERQKKSQEWKKDQGKYIPYPATWLNGGCWNDELSERRNIAYG